MDRLLQYQRGVLASQIIKESVHGRLDARGSRHVTDATYDRKLMQVVAKSRVRQSGLTLQRQPKGAFSSSGVRVRQRAQNVS